MNSLALVYMSAARYQDAKDVFLQCVPIFEKRLGAEDVDVAVTLGSIADADRLLGQYDEAQAQLDRVRAFINRNPKKFGGDFAWQLDIRYARLYLDEDKPALADASMRTALAAMPKGANEAQGPLVDTESDAPIRASLLDLQARIHAAENRLPEAMKESRAALRIFAVRAARVTGRGGNARPERSPNCAPARPLGGRRRRYQRAPRRQAIPPRAQCWLHKLSRSPDSAPKRPAPKPPSPAWPRSSSRTDAWRSVDPASGKTRSTNGSVSMPSRRKPQVCRRIGATRVRMPSAARNRRFGRPGSMRSMLSSRANFRNMPKSPIRIRCRLRRRKIFLKPEEALLTYLVSDKESFLWVVRHDQAALLRLAIGRKRFERRRR